MNKKKFWFVIVFLILLLGAGWWVKKREVGEKVEEVVEVKEIEEVGQVELVLDFGEGKISSYSARIDERKTVLEILSQIAQENNFSLESKDSDFGVFIEEISGVKNSQDHFWMYYVNGQMAEVSADQYQLQHDDVVEWKYEEITP